MTGNARVPVMAFSAAAAFPGTFDENFTQGRSARRCIALVSPRSCRSWCAKPPVVDESFAIEAPKTKLVAGAVTGIVFPMR